MFYVPSVVECVYNKLRSYELHKPVNVTLLTYRRCYSQATVILLSPRAPSPARFRIGTALFVDIQVGFLRTLCAHTQSMGKIAQLLCALVPAFVVGFVPVFQSVHHSNHGINTNHENNNFIVKSRWISRSLAAAVTDDPLSERDSRGAVLAERRAVLDKFFRKMMTEPSSLQREDISHVIDVCFAYTPTEFKVGDLIVLSSQDDYACQAIALAASFGADMETTMRFFGKDAYAAVVHGAGDAKDYAILRAFAKGGWEAVKFEGQPIVAKDEAPMIEAKVEEVGKGGVVTVHSSPETDSD
jgi:hypothetical protein